MSMWSVMKAPILLGTDVTNMTAATLATLTAPEVIRVNQDTLGIQAKLLQNSSAHGSDSTRLPLLGANRGDNASAWAWAVSELACKLMEGSLIRPLSLSLRANLPLSYA